MPNVAVLVLGCPVPVFEPGQNIFRVVWCTDDGWRVIFLLYPNVYDVLTFFPSIIAPLWCIYIQNFIFSIFIRQRLVLQPSKCFIQMVTLVVIPDPNAIPRTKFSPMVCDKVK